MYRRAFVLLILVAVLGIPISAMAEFKIVPVANYSFEMPAAGKQKCWDGEKSGSTDVPGWSSDLVPSDSGVEMNSGATDGDWIGFLKGDLESAGDGSIWNLLPYVIQAGDQFMLNVDATSTWNAPTLTMSLYYHAVGGERITAATQDVALSGAWESYSLYFEADSVPDSIGHKLGIEINNPETGWAGIDNVVIPEPATFALLGLGVLPMLRRRRA